MGERLDSRRSENPGLLGPLVTAFARQETLLWAESVHFLHLDTLALPSSQVRSLRPTGGSLIQSSSYALRQVRREVFPRPEAVEIGYVCGLHF
jgi:hypothetical protein